jgi:hypothetical protein
MMKKTSAKVMATAKAKMITIKLRAMSFILSILIRCHQEGYLPGYVLNTSDSFILVAVRA